jgi:ribulose bisphosphate carboxylase small subunit
MQKEQSATVADQLDMKDVAILQILLIDKDLSTRWAAFGDGQWLQLDMGTADTLKAINIAWFKGFERTVSFDVQTSLDNSTWKTVYNGKSSGTSVTFEKVKLPTTVARYIRIVGHGSNIHLWNAINEIEVLGSMPMPQLQKLMITRASATADDRRGNIASNAIDSDPNSRWSAFGDGQSLQLTLSNPDTIKQVRIAWYKGDIRTADFFIQVSTDTVNWKTVYTGKTSGKTTLFQVNNVADTAVKYVRVVSLGNSVNDWNSITEVELWGSVSPLVSQYPTIATFAQTQQLSVAKTDKLSPNGRLARGGTQNKLPGSTEFVLWPNPSKGFFYVKSDLSVWRGGELKIYNSQGKVVLARHINQSTTSFNLSEKAKGVYFIKLKNGINEVNSKIIIQ